MYSKAWEKNMARVRRIKAFGQPLLGAEVTVTGCSRRYLSQHALALPCPAATQQVQCQHRCCASEQGALTRLQAPCRVLEVNCRLL